MFSLFRTANLTLFVFFQKKANFGSSRLNHPNRTKIRPATPTTLFDTEYDHASNNKPNKDDTEQINEKQETV